MPDYAAEIAALLGSAPADLAAFYERGGLPSYPDSRIHCLPFGEARAYTLDVQGIPVVERLGLWVLDDANDSNPYAFVSKGPCAGAILHFTHDDDSRITHASLAGFLAALRVLGESGGDIDNLAPEVLSLVLDAELEALAHEDSEEAVFLINAYLSASGAPQDATRTALLGHGDFFVREALAAHLGRLSRAQDLAAVQQLAADAHPQVAAAGKAALGALRRAGVR
jgi:hypothetical protein